MTKGALADIVIGLVFSAGGVGIIVHASGLRNMPGTMIGSGLFPTITGALMALFGLALTAEAFFGKSGDPSIPETRRQIGYSLIVLVGLVGLILLTPVIGFLIAGAIFATGVARAGGAGWIGSVLCGVGLTLALYFIFVHGLGVPLPRGPLG